MTFRRFFPLLLFALLASACGKKSTRSGPDRSYPDPTTSLEEARLEAVKTLGEKGERARAVWDGVRGADAWTAAALTEIERQRAVWERARDLEDFCPGYAAATAYQRDTCWLRLVSGMARFESNFHPEATFEEATGGRSVGLLMMNPEHCAQSPTIEKLKNPLANIACATERLALLVGRDGWISGQGNSGGAAYWSVLRAPYQAGSLFLGRRPHIQVFTRSYRGYQPASPRTDFSYTP